MAMLVICPAALTAMLVPSETEVRSPLRSLADEISPKRGTIVDVFISRSGERIRARAETLREWDPLVLHFVNPWLSESDIEAGVRYCSSDSSPSLT